MTITQDTINTIMEYHKQGLSNRVIGQKVGVSRETVRKIVNQNPPIIVNDVWEEKKKQIAEYFLDHQHLGNPEIAKIFGVSTSTVSRSIGKYAHVPKEQLYERIQVLAQEKRNQRIDRERETILNRVKAHLTSDATIPMVAEKTKVSEKFIRNAIKRGELSASDFPAHKWYSPRKSSTSAGNHRENEVKKRNHDEMITRVKAHLTSDATIAKVAKTAKVSEKFIYYALRNGELSATDFPAQKWSPRKNYSILAAQGTAENKVSGNYHQQCLARVKANLNNDSTIAKVAKTAKVSDKFIYRAIRNGELHSSDFPAQKWSPRKNHSPTLIEDASHIKPVSETTTVENVVDETLDIPTLVEDTPDIVNLEDSTATVTEIDIVSIPVETPQEYHQRKFEEKRRTLPTPVVYYAKPPRKQPPPIEKKPLPPPVVYHPKPYKYYGKATGILSKI